MLIMITGGAASGKSEFGEQVCMKLSERKLYIATMEPYGKEALQRIKRHTDMRKTKGFDTLEKYTKLYECDCKDYELILLECMSTLLANEFFTEKNYFENIVSGIEKLKSSCNHLVMITNEVFSDGETYGEETTEYTKALGRINRTLASQADVVIEVVFGIPVFLKGAEYKHEIL